MNGNQNQKLPVLVNFVKLSDSLSSMQNHVFNILKSAKKLGLIGYVGYGDWYIRPIFLSRMVSRYVRDSRNLMWYSSIAQPLQYMRNASIPPWARDLTLKKLTNKENKGEMWYDS